jgi:hypothetical protein
MGYRIHPGNASADTELIEREAHAIDGRYGAKLDFGELHHYLAWVYLRTGQRRRSVPHLARAAALGQVSGVGRTLAVLLRDRIGRRFPGLRQQAGALEREWTAEAERWIAPLRESLA